MKVRIWILTLLIGMISFAGFGQAPDLIQDSRAFDFPDFENVQNQWQLIKEFRIDVDDGYFIVKVYNFKDGQIAVCSELSTDDIAEKQKCIKQKTKEKPFIVKHFKKPRDGLNVC